jgi:hypothetical protein
VKKKDAPATLAITRNAAAMAKNVVSVKNRRAND